MTAKLLQLPERRAPEATLPNHDRAPAPIVQMMPRTRRRVVGTLIATPPFELPEPETLPAWARVLIPIGLSIGLWAMILGVAALIAGG